MKLTKLHLFIILLLVLQFPLFDRVIENKTYNDYIE